MNEPIDYQDMIDEIKDEVNTGSLSNDEIIQVLRDTASSDNNYHPIIDWYYNKKAMSIELSAEGIEDKEDLKEIMLLRQQYQNDEPNLEEITVEACLKEMFEKTTKKTGKKNKGNNPFF